MAVHDRSLVRDGALRATGVHGPLARSIDIGFAGETSSPGNLVLGETTCSARDPGQLRFSFAFGADEQLDARRWQRAQRVE